MSLAAAKRLTTQSSLLGFAAVVLVSSAVSANRFFDGFRGARGVYAHATKTQREHVALQGTDLHAETWDFIRAHVTQRDRYVIETPTRLGAGFHRYMRTFAGYWLLPAVAVSRVPAGDVIVYIGQHGPRGSTCREKPQIVCVLHLRP